MIIREWSRLGGFNLDIDYKDHMYTEKQIEQMYLGISHLLNQMLESPNKKLMELEILPEDMWNKLIYEFNATNRGIQRTRQSISF